MDTNNGVILPGIVRVGGYASVVEKYPNAVPDTFKSGNSSECGRPPPDAFHFVREITDPQYPWPGVIFGLTISAIWYWCSDQVW